MPASKFGIVNTVKKIEFFFYYLTHLFLSY